MGHKQALDYTLGNDSSHQPQEINNEAGSDAHMSFMPNQNDDSLDRADFLVDHNE